MYPLLHTASFLYLHHHVVYITIPPIFTLLERAHNWMLRRVKVLGCMRIL